MYIYFVTNGSYSLDNLITNSKDLCLLWVQSEFLPFNLFLFKAMNYKKCLTTKSFSVFGIVGAMVRAPQFVAVAVTVTAI